MSTSATSTHLLNTSRNDDSTSSLGSLFQCSTTLEEFFFNIQSKPSPVQLNFCFLNYWHPPFLQKEACILTVAIKLHYLIYSKNINLDVCYGSFKCMKVFVTLKCKCIYINTCPWEQCIALTLICWQPSWFLSFQGRKIIACLYNPLHILKVLC